MTRTKLIAYSALMCALLIVSTLWFKFNIPGTGVLFTTQVLFVLLCGQILPPAACLAAIGAYLALGLLGVPVFSATQGLAVMATPSFGYLLGFPVAAVLPAAVRRFGLVKSRYEDDRQRIDERNLYEKKSNCLDVFLGIRGGECAGA